jgi:hypothetical protein
MAALATAPSKIVIDVGGGASSDVAEKQGRCQARSAW